MTQTSDVSARYDALKKQKTALVAEGMGIYAKAKRENRALTVVDKGRDNEIQAKLRDLNAQIALELDKVFDYDSAGPNAGTVSNPSPGRWQSLGELLHAVARADLGGRVDPRLQKVHAATGANEGVPADGGYLVQQDFGKNLLQAAYETAQLASRSRRVPITPAANGLKLNGLDETSRADGFRWGGIRAYWKDEAAAATASKPKFRQVNLSLNRLTGLLYATDELFQDLTAFEAIVTSGFAEEFAFKIDDAIYRADGASKPLGILNSPALITVAKEGGQGPATFVYQNAVKMFSRLAPRCVRTARWFVNKDTIPQLYTMTIPVGTGGAPIFVPDSNRADAPFGTLLNLPIEPIEQASQLGTVGDIVLADLSQYLLIDKGAIDVKSSIHVKFLEDEMAFRFIVRVDGQSAWHQAVTPYLGTGTVSPFITLETRS